MKRREFLTGTALAGLSSFTMVRTGTPQVVRPEDPFQKARNIIFMVYDGFSWEDLAVARHYSHRHLGKALALERLLALGNSGSMLTHSLTSVVTDSAAASTAWGTGRRIVNGYLGLYPDGRKLTTILELAKSQGRATGLITTTRVTHATPAGFVAHVKDRDWEDEIAEQYLILQPDVILGGGSRHFRPESRTDGRDLSKEFAAKGYSTVQTERELDGLSGSKVLGTFSPSHLPYEIDRVHQSAGGPSLKQITQKGLELLSQNSDGFIVQVEAGRIDHANHDNDPGTMVWDVLAADDALETVLNFADANPDTLVILASDHGTGGGAVYGIGSDYLQASRTFDKVALRRASYEFVLGELGDSPQLAEVIEAVGEFLGTAITGEEGEFIIRAIQGQVSMPNAAAYHEQPENSLAWALADGKKYDDPDHLNIHYTAGQHTGGPVPVALYGSTASEAKIGLVDITNIFGWLCSALGVRHENPIMSEQEALAILDGRIAATGTEG